jgi:hypothetical protein
MSFNYVDSLQAIVNALSDYNTLTASPDLSDGLVHRIKSIVSDDVDIASIRGDSFPMIFVKILDKQEAFETMGRTGATGNKKSCLVNYEICGVYRKDNAYDTGTDLVKNVYKLAQNIEGVFEQELTLSGTAL